MPSYAAHACHRYASAHPDTPFHTTPQAQQRASLPTPTVGLTPVAADPEEGRGAKRSRQEMIQERQLQRNRARGRGHEDVDPMDPAAYSDAPKGGWSTGLEGVQPRAADTTAGGPLFQSRPYPAPGAVLRANQKALDQ